MSICKFCNKEQAGASSCIESIIQIGKESYKPKPYQPKFLKRNHSVTRCPECNVLAGGYHHVGCSLEICPKCGFRWIFCQCFGKKIKPGAQQTARIIPLIGQR